MTSKQHFLLALVLVLFTGQTFANKQMEEKNKKVEDLMNKFCEKPTMTEEKVKETRSCNRLFDWVPPPIEVCQQQIFQGKSYEESRQQYCKASKEEKAKIGRQLSDCDKEKEDPGSKKQREEMVSKMNAMKPEERQAYTLKKMDEYIACFEKAIQ